MRARVLRFAALGTAALGLAMSLGACGGSSTDGAKTVSGWPAPVSQNAPSRYKVGSAYSIAGARYKPEERFVHEEIGQASWYGPGFHGRSTANGEPFDQRALTAAHRTLQLPSIIRVTNIGNGKSVVLRVNDRGPYHGGRVLDVSEAAAEVLGFKHLGVAQVRIEVLDAPSREVAALAGNGATIRDLEAARLRAADAPPQRPAPAAPDEIKLASIGRDVDANRTAAPPSVAYVQAGAFADIANARRLQSIVRPLGPTELLPTLADGRQLYRVRIGPYADLAAAEAALERALALGALGAHLVTIQ